MRSRFLRRSFAGAGVAVSMVVLAAGPASAHFCRKVDFNPTAAQHAAASQAWLSADEWREFLPFIEADCPGITGAIEPILSEAEASGTTLFMGPGLLAGGTLRNGNTPEHFGYMLDAFIEHCPAEQHQRRVEA